MAGTTRAPRGAGNARGANSQTAGAGASATVAAAKGSRAKYTEEQDDERRAAQQEWAKDRLTDVNTGKLIDDHVVAVPEFVLKGKEWVPVDDISCTRPSKSNPAMYGSVLLMGVGNGSAINNISQLRWKNGGSNSLISCLELGANDYLETFEAGELYPGRIDTAYQPFETNPADPEQDLHYVSGFARRAGERSLDKDGNTIYSVRFFQPDMDKDEPEIIPVANLTQIQQNVAAWRLANEGAGMGAKRLGGN